MYTDMYNTFDDKNIPYYYPKNFNEYSTDYAPNKCIPTYEMVFEDTLILPFKICECYANSYINIIVYNFRHEEIYCETLLPDENNTVYLNIIDEISSTKFKRGYYYIQIQAENLVGTAVSVTTILPQDECILYVR